MSTRARYLIKFKHGGLACLRERLLEDLSREHFAVLLGKTQCAVSALVKLLDNPVGARERWPLGQCLT